VILLDFYYQKKDRGWSLMTRWIFTLLMQNNIFSYVKISWSYNNALKQFSPALQNNAGENTIQKPIF